MNRTEFIGTNLYYSQEFVDDIINELIEKRTNRIDKAIEFVEKWKYENGDGSVFFDINTNPTELLDILKGEE